MSIIIYPDELYEIEELTDIIQLKKRLQELKHYSGTIRIPQTDLEWKDVNKWLETREKINKKIKELEMPMNRQKKRTELMLQVKKLDKEKKIEYQMKRLQQEEIETHAQIDWQIRDLKTKKEEVSGDVRNADCRFQQCKKQINKLLLQMEECADE